jgi:hypothetical protein
VKATATTFPTPPAGGYFDSANPKFAQRVRRAQRRATAIVAGDPVNEYAVDIPERNAYVSACVASLQAAPAEEAPVAVTAAATPTAKRATKVAATVAANVTPAADLGGCLWKTSGKLCGREIQEGFRFCAKHVAQCEKNGYPQRAFPKASKGKASKEAGSAPASPAVPAPLDPPPPVKAHKNVTTAPVVAAIDKTIIARKLDRLNDIVLEVGHAAIYTPEITAAFIEAETLLLELIADCGVEDELIALKAGEV